MLYAAYHELQQPVIPEAGTCVLPLIASHIDTTYTTIDLSELTFRPGF